MARRKNGQRANYEIWPGFVDALTTLLLVIIFLLVVFVLAQFFLSQALSGRDAALEKLNQQVAELADLLALEKETNVSLKQEIAALNITLTQSNQDRDNAIIQLDTITARALAAEEERDELTLLLQKQEQKTADTEAALKEAEERIKLREDEIAANLKDIESLKRDISSLEELRKKLESEVGALAARIKEKDTEIGEVRDRSKELEAKLADEQERTLLAQKDIEDRETKLAELQTLYLQTQDNLTAEEKISSEAQAQVQLLNVQLSALREQLARIESALEIAEQKDIEQKAQIADLGRRLNQALAQKVQELQQYRSDFFGRLREVLKNRPGVSVVGDRFVFQSEVLFGLGEAELGEQGRQSMRAFAQTLLEISSTIPDDIDWVLRVDGHTDKQPISTVRFPSNWELSMARALSVTKYLVARGVPPTRLAPTGFGPYQPLDPRDDEIAFLRNRRIELKLTER
ncbi:peptidoglycan -binding protein [Sneathiella sp. P13V-1]|uniref:peptidoglycan -binding protein n=1 Tax=Sneathiella sp. P13V-1 TaxID=2697366 RepID=UPI00187B5BDE|nr:peptidoglycan -binding protein [Sneathiella sp. P13V-1]MBE7637991.1 peptidoglycan -binding protein [Sneathiella sp. P13V-1]